MPRPGAAQPDAPRSEAAAWIARLHADSVSHQDREAFRLWLAEDPANRAAFAAVTEAWDAVGGLRDRVSTTATASAPRWSRRRVFASVGAIAVAGGLSGLWQRSHAVTYQTGLGEQHRVSLDDGSDLLLDTDTEIRVTLDGTDRRATLNRGRIRFSATAARRPFSLSVGDEIVLASAATLDMRCDARHVSVVCLKGDAVVEMGSTAPQHLAIGDRFSVSGGRAVLDRPTLTPLIAWQSGQAAFDNTSLGDAAQEMNRYSKLKLVVTDPRIANLRISGTYQVGDNRAFARSIASLLPIRIQQSDTALTIVADPAQKTSREG